MAQTTNIAWCDSTWSPWWGCIKVSPGCEHCYMGTMTKRWGYNVWGPAKTTDRRVFGHRHWSKPLDWNKLAASGDTNTVRGGHRRLVFPSMCDPFEEHQALIAERIQLWALINSTPNLDWLLLTKRIENVPGMVPSKWMHDGFPENVWTGVSIENEDYVGRLDGLRALPARVRFISYEPALGLVRWTRERLAGMHWMIVGGESGGGARPFNTNWARQTIMDCSFAGVATFVKQLGSKPINSTGVRIKLKAYKGDDPLEWPEELRRREFPVGSRELVPA